jgi:hypothetical protein
MRRALRTVLLALLAGITLLSELGETAIVQRSLEELIQEADTVVIGTVTTQLSTWDDQHTAIGTDVTVTIEANLKGSRGVGVDVTFRIAGGIVGDVGMRSSTDPVFQNGDRVILFLDTARVPFRIVGQLLGALKISDGMVTRHGHREAVDDIISAVRAASR